MALDLSASMRGALAATRSGNPAEATRLLQQALSGAPVSENAAKPGPAQKINRNAETLKPEGTPGDLLQKIAARMRQGGHNASSLTTPEGAQWLSRDHGKGTDARPYRLYVPSGTPRGLIVMLHGCSQNAEDFALGTDMNTVAESRDFIALWPEQPTTINAHGCWQWFEPNHQQRSGGEPQTIAEIVKVVTREYDLAEGRALVAGLSAGGAMTAILAQVWPELFAAAAIHSGLAFGAAGNMGSAFSAMRSPVPGIRGQSEVPTFILHGSTDSTVHPGNADSISTSVGFDDHRTDETIGVENGRSTRKRRATGNDGGLRHESWLIEGAGHAWSGGNPAGSQTDASGPDASSEILRFFDEVAGG